MFEIPITFFLDFKKTVNKCIGFVDFWDTTKRMKKHD